MKFKWILLALVLFVGGMWAGRSLFPKTLLRPKKSLQVNDINPVIGLQYFISPKIG